MFEKKQYFTSSFCLKNRYCVKKELAEASYYEKWMLTKDEYNYEYALLLERIGNVLPDKIGFYSMMQLHESVIYPIDLIMNSNVYVFENEIGYVYPPSVLEFKNIDHIMRGADKEKKVKVLTLLCRLIKDLHQKGIYLNGFDKKQVLIKTDEIKIRYNGFKTHNRNSIYKVPDVIAKNYFLKDLWMLDIFSLAAITFEYIYQWNPFRGMMTSFSEDEEHQFEVFYNNFRKKIFIFERNNQQNPIGFLMDQRYIIEKWEKTSPEICDFFHNVLTMDFPKNLTQENVFEKLEMLVDYYKNSEVFQ